VRVTLTRYSMMLYQGILTSSFAGEFGLLYHKIVRKSEIVLGIILSIVSLLLFLKVLAEVLTKDIVFIDTIVLNFIYSFRDPFLTPIMHFVSLLGGEFTLLSATIIVVVFTLKKHKKEAAFFAFIVLFGYVFNIVLKQFLKIPRPEDPIAVLGFYGFPSGHAMNSFIFYGLTAYFTFHFTRNRGLSVLVAIFFTLLILLIGFSRLYLGVHYPSDVLAGFIAGFWWLTTAILIGKSWTYYKLVKHKQK